MKSCREKRFSLASYWREIPYGIQALDSSLIQNLVRQGIAASTATRQYGLMVVISIINFFAAMIDLEEGGSRAWAEGLNCLVSATVIVGMATLWNIYTEEARRHGSRPPLSRTPGGESFLFSPLWKSQVAELVLWSIHTPPLLSQYFPSVQYYNFFAFFKLYIVLVYLNYSNVISRAFCRAVSGVSGVPLTTSLHTRSLLVYRKFLAVGFSCAILWTGLSFMYSKAEKRTILDSYYVVFVTAATIGYGDISPATFPGRCVAFLSWIGGMTIVGFTFSMVQQSLALNPHEEVLFSVFRLSAKEKSIDATAATTIQRWYRLLRLRHRYSRGLCTRGAFVLRSWWVGNTINGFRRERHELRRALQRVFSDVKYGAIGAPSGAESNDFHAAVVSDIAQRVGRMGDDIAELRHQMNDLTEAIRAALQLQRPLEQEGADKHA